jgi:hypothetical protein
MVIDQPKYEQTDGIRTGMSEDILALRKNGAKLSGKAYEPSLETLSAKTVDFSIRSRSPLPFHLQHQMR